MATGHCVVQTCRRLWEDADQPSETLPSPSPCIHPVLPLCPNKAVALAQQYASAAPTCECT